MATVMLRVRAFAGCPSTHAAVTPCRTRVLAPRARHSRTTYATKEASIPTPSSSLPLALTVALGALGATASRAFAEDVVTSSSSANTFTISPADAEVLAASASGSGTEEIVVSLLFGVVVLLLAIVTGGVAYINIKQWLDSRQEKEDRDRDGKAPAAPDGGAVSKSDADKVIPLRRASRIKKEKGKGFAEFNSRR